MKLCGWTDVYVFARASADHQTEPTARIGWMRAATLRWTLRWKLRALPRRFRRTFIVRHGATIPATRGARQLRRAPCRRPCRDESKLRRLKARRWACAWHEPTRARPLRRKHTSSVRPRPPSSRPSEASALVLPAALLRRLRPPRRLRHDDLIHPQDGNGRFSCHLDRLPFGVQQVQHA